MPGNGSSLPEWLARLETLSPHEIDLGLDRVAAVLGRLDVDRPGRVFHVAGTNGKGSSVAMLEALLLYGGERVGSYTSPHMIDYNERIRVDGEPASDADIVAAFEHVEAARDDVPLTYFEFGTLAALVVFARSGVDSIILEVGMGGRLDAVNAVEPDAGLITNVSLDHCDWLGNDIETIAGEKAGIMRDGKPVVFASRLVPDAITEQAASSKALLVLVGRDYDWSVDEDRWHWRGVRTELSDLRPPSLAGEFQVGNAAGALALIEAAGLDSLLNARTVNAALDSVALPGRLQRIDVDRHFVLDVAHNPAAANVLAETLAVPFDGQTVAIVALLEDKDIDGIVTLLSTVVDRWIAVRAESPRSVAPEELGRVIANVSNAGCLVAPSIDEALDYAREITSVDDRILVTGSFYLVGPTLRRLR